MPLPKTANSYETIFPEWNSEVLQVWLDSLNDNNREESIQNCLDCGYFKLKEIKNVTTQNTDNSHKADK